MAGDFIGVSNSKQTGSDVISGVGGQTSTEPLGEISSIFYNEALDGIPRRDDLFAIRLLGQTTQIEWLKDIIKNQVASTDFQVNPVTEEDEEPDELQVEAAEAVEEFLEGGFNTDNQSFDDLLKIILDDLLDFNSGVIELVPDQQGKLQQMIARDGLTFTKNVQETGLLPPPSSGEPAYYQFSPAAHTQSLTSNRDGIDLRNSEILRRVQQLPYSRFFGRETKEFSRSQIAWFSESPNSHDPYGRGKTQKVKKAAEIMINGDEHRNRFFLDNEFHKGFLNVSTDVSQKDKEKIKRRFKQNAGNEHEMQVIGAENAQYVSIDPEPEKMQFLESQKWYTRLVISAYGLNDVEAGFLEDANKGISDDAKRKIFRQTTEPLLSMIERKFNNIILPKMREYEAVDGQIRFEFKPQNKFLETLENEIIDQELSNHTITLNEARERKGKQPFGELGELPATAFEEYAQNNPAFVVENLTDLEDVPSGDGGGNNPFDSLNLNINNDQLKEAKVREIEEEPESKATDLHSIKSYDEAFQHRDALLERTKDALRNQRGFDDVPGIVDHKEKLKEEVAKVFQSINLDEQLEKEFPEDEQENGVLVNADKIVDNINFRERLGSVLETNNLNALEMSAEHHERNIESETEERLNVPDETKIELSFNVLDTFTADIIRQEALSAATGIESSVKNRLASQILKGAEEGEGIDQIKQRVGKIVSDISDNNAELVARTETLSASRKGSQALAESTDLVAGKEWIATNDNRTRQWHREMDGQIVPKDQQFTVPKVSSDDQPSDYPRTARVVGEDQPFNCRCSQAPVLSEDMPEDVQTLSDKPGVQIDLGITKRQLEVWQENSDEQQTSFKQFWQESLQEMSKRQITKEYGMSKTTVYNWEDQLG